MSDFLELAVSAAASGCVYGLVALAYLLMIRPTGIINFAVGEWAMVGAFGGFLLLSKYEWPYAVGMAAVLAFMFLVGWATERVAVRPLVERGAPLLAPILALLGMLVVFREAISVSFPPDPHPVPYPFGIGRLEIGPVGGSYQSFFIIAVTLVVFAAVWLFFERTVAGKAFEAVAIHRRAAALMGINLPRVTALSFAGGAVAAGLAGLLVSPEHLGALPHGRAARHPGLHRAGDRRGGAGRRRAARRPSARLCRAADRALRPHPVGVHAGRAARFSDDLPAGAPHRFAESEGMSYARWIGAFVILAALPFFMGSYYNDVYRKTLLAVTLALSYNFLFGICGQVAFSHFAFYGLGAYSIVILLFQFGMPFALAVVLGVLLCVLVALAVAIPSTRLEGFYLALATLALAQLFVVVLNEGGALTGGTGGLANYRLPEVFGLRIAGPWYSIVDRGAAPRHARGAVAPG